MEELIEKKEMQEEKVEEKPTTNEEKATKTYTEEEVKELLAQTKKNAFEEGKRKASKLNEQNQTDELSNLQASLKEKEDEALQLKSQIEAFKQVQKMDELGIDRKFQEDMLAIIKGKGMEVTEETITELADNHPEWKVQVESRGIEVIGQSKNVDEEAKRKMEQYEDDRKYFGLPSRKRN